ncbi:xanthine dehydrogenase accessory protein XdhC [Jannaschia sp. Os4]|uniref:xanthine dehydrogenase accessory protein XdhC n=1 Tax=Jannaschia sp. Os4 TaxID=2807617 RepID=UPI001939BF1C|nr:xanthine dehydrogenase accessory protein XdhC [Jannaschia sp. Os4]MBM2575096.1 xanthine dehydrogenase accessory protein XdhC [Jannaschia sp. Os4]
MITVTVASTRGSVPREGGASMTVTEEGQTGTIGGGRLEWEAAAHARAMMARGETRDRRTYPLGPALGQCCGGAVTLAFEAGRPEPTRAGPPLWVWGAGHVGRAVVATMSPLADRPITWIDFDPDRFPDPAPDGVDTLAAAEPARLMPRAPSDADHLILTHSHDLDLALCHAALSHGFRSCGLIGSATKWARFEKRLRALGHADLGRIACPIGDPTLGKHPQAIAVGVAAALLRPGTKGDS